MTLFSLKPVIPDAAPRPRDGSSKEKMFLDHYSWLRECALNITHGQHEHAEDLVHEVFVRFLDKDADVASISDIRGYLNGMLRNLHLLQLRRTTRHPVHSLSLFDYDSALVGLRTWNSTDQLQSTDLLVRACDFACYRKEAALTASILILRFFHGYYPGEIALLLKARRRAVDQWIERGRLEIKRYMEAPYPLPASGAPERKVTSVATTNAFLRLLRERVFHSCTTDCSVLADDARELGAKELAHLVSCRACLDLRCRKMGLTHVTERMADDISDRDDGRPQGGSGGNGEIFSLRSRRKPSKRAILREVYARRGELFEHRPTEISLAFDGLLRATLVVNAATNTLNLSLDSKEIPNSIAILSEQEFNFLLLDRDDLTCGERRVHRLPLSDDRLLEVTVTPETLGPAIQVVYKDPLFSVVTCGEEEDLPCTITKDDPILNFPLGRADSATDSGHGWRTTLFDRLQSFVPSMNPLLTGAIVFGIAAVLCFVFWLRSAPSLSVGALLDRAQKSERAAVANNRPGVLYQKVAIRTQHRSLERTIYRDAQGFRRPRRPKLSPEDEQLKNRLAIAGVNWDAPLSAFDYSEWRRSSGATRDEVTRSGEHLLTLTATPLSTGEVLKEALTVRDTDFHPVDRTIELRDSGTVDIAELNYGELPWGPPTDGLFEPVADATPILPRTVHPATTFHLPRVLSEAEFNEAELEVRLALHQLGADSHERIDIARGGNSVTVRGVVATEERKREIESRLRSIPNVTGALFTFDELRNHLNSANPVTSLQQSSVVEAPSPLESYLAAKGASQTEIGQLGLRLSNASVTVNRESKAIAELLEHFSGKEPLTENARMALNALLADHRAQLQAGIDGEEKLLAEAGLSAPPDTNSGAGDLSAIANRNNALCLELLTGSEERSRPANVILPELAATIAQLRAVASQQIGNGSAARASSAPPNGTTTHR